MSDKGKTHNGNGKRHNTTWEIGLSEGTPRRVEAAGLRHEDGCLILLDEHGDPVFASRAAVYAHRLPVPEPDSSDVPARDGLKLPARDRA